MTEKQIMYVLKVLEEHHPKSIAEENLRDLCGYTLSLELTAKINRKKLLKGIKNENCKCRIGN